MDNFKRAIYLTNQELDAIQDSMQFTAESLANSESDFEIRTLIEEFYTLNLAHKRLTDMMGCVKLMEAMVNREI